MKTVNLRGTTAVVTGASSGLGSIFARRLAGMGADLLITARRTERLQTLATEIEDSCCAKVRLFPLDLESPDAPLELHTVAESLEKPVSVLINNAGFSSNGPFLATPLPKLSGQVRVNVLALTELTYLFANSMKARGSGHILNVASIASYMPIPYFAVYAATKAYVKNFTQATAYELEGTGVSLCSLCPGIVATEFWEVSGQKEAPEIMFRKADSPDAVVDTGLEALFRGKTNVVAGRMNSTAAFMTRFGWPSLLNKISAKVSGNKK